MSTGIPGQHSGSIASLASANYYGSATSGPEQHSPAKYPENGHDTLSDFVTFVCQEAESSQGAQVCILKYIYISHCYTIIINIKISDTYRKITLIILILVKIFISNEKILISY